MRLANLPPSRPWATVSAASRGSGSPIAPSATRTLWRERRSFRDGGGEVRGVPAVDARHQHVSRRARGRGPVELAAAAAQGGAQAERRVYRASGGPLRDAAPGGADREQPAEARLLRAGKTSLAQSPPEP